MTDLFTNHLRFGDLDDWHRSVDDLRSQGSVIWVDQSEQGFTPFWAVIGHEAVMAIERQPELFTNEPNAVLGRIADIARRWCCGAFPGANGCPRSPQVPQAHHRLV
jgi:hypothetical protein